MAKGAIAKEYVAKKLIEAFGADYIGEVDKKHYVYGVENGEKIQIAISMTCPKVPVATSGYIHVQTGDYNFEDDASYTITANIPEAPVEISEKERENIAALMAKLGL